MVNLVSIRKNFETVNVMIRLQKYQKAKNKKTNHKIQFLKTGYLSKISVAMIYLPEKHNVAKQAVSNITILRFLLFFHIYFRSTDLLHSGWSTPCSVHRDMILKKY